MPLACTSVLGSRRRAAELQHLRRHLSKRRAVKRHGARTVGRGDLDEALERVGQLAARRMWTSRSAAADVRPADVTEPGEQDLVQDLRAAEVQDPAATIAPRPRSARWRPSSLRSPARSRGRRRPGERQPGEREQEIATVRAVSRRSSTTDRVWTESAGSTAVVLVSTSVATLRPRGETCELTRNGDGTPQTADAAHTGPWQNPANEHSQPVPRGRAPHHLRAGVWCESVRASEGSHLCSARRVDDPQGVLAPANVVASRLANPVPKKRRGRLGREALVRRAVWWAAGQTWPRQWVGRRRVRARRDRAGGLLTIAAELTGISCSRRRPAVEDAPCVDACRTREPGHADDRRETR